MPNQSTETIIAIIDTAFCIDKFSMSDSVWINPNEIAEDGLDNDNNGYIDDIQGYNFCEMNQYINNDAEHGTAILGIMCAKPKLEGYKNVIGNYNIKVMCVKTLNDVTESASITSVVESIKYAEANGANVCCLSFGTITYSKELQEKIKNLKCFLLLKIDYTSNYGKSSVDLVAPGTDIVSVNPSGGFAYFFGTSYAVPFVGGVAEKYIV